MSGWNVLIALVVTLGLFLIFRAVVLWYWKINKIEEHLESIVVLLRKLTENK